MLTNTFHLSAYIPKQVMGEDQDATTFINGAIYQSTWISNFKRSSATITLSKNISKWLETTLQHSTKYTRNCSGYQPMLTRGHIIIPQKGTTVNKFKADILKLNKKTGLRMDALNVLEVPLGMPTLETHSTRRQERTSLRPLVFPAWIQQRKPQ